jgi:hypothetical protein
MKNIIWYKRRIAYCRLTKGMFDFFLEYFDWHRSVTKNLNQTNCHHYQYLVLTCDKDQTCGGLSDRLTPLPFFLVAAARFKRIFMIYWEQPQRLEEFLLPNEINWTVPSWLYDIVGSENIKRSERGKDLSRHLQQSSKKLVVKGNLQERWGGTQRYQQLVEADNCTDFGLTRRSGNQTAAYEQLHRYHDLGAAAYRNFYHDMFRSMFTPVPPIAQLTLQRLKSTSLTPGLFAGAHFRAFYGTNDEKTIPHKWQRKWAINAVNCASILQPGSPVYFASDSIIAVQAVQEYASTENRSIVTLPNDHDPIPIEMAPGWESRPASDLYTIFVDLLLLGSGRCVAYGSGGYGRYASLLSHDSSCAMEHGPTTRICNWRDRLSPGSAIDYIQRVNDRFIQTKYSAAMVVSAMERSNGALLGSARPLARSLLDQTSPIEKDAAVKLTTGRLVASHSTIVTAYYQIPSKHSPDRYVNWMENMLSLQDPMVIFTQPNFVDQISELRSHATNRTVIVPLSLNKLPIGTLFSHAFWQDQIEKDPEKKIHRSYELFWIWLSKSWFMVQAVQMNFFDSNIYVWSDIGCFRNSNYNSKVMVVHPESVPRRQILQMATRKINPPTHSLYNDKINHPSHFYHSGSQFAGYKNTILTFHEYFLETIDKFLANNMTIVEDQVVLQSTCLQHPTICAYVQRKHVNDNAYFGLRYILHHGGNITKYWTLKTSDW